MSRKISIYVSDAVQALFNPKFGNDESRSGRLTDVARRYQTIIRDEVARLPFSQQEWLALLEVGMDAVGFGAGDDEAQTGMPVTSDDGRYLWASVQDASDQDARFGVDHVALARRVRGLSVAGRMALIETLRDFWSGAHPIHESHVARLIRFGVRFPEVVAP